MKKLDIVVVLDDSTSEGIDGFHSIKEFAIGLMRDMEVGPDKTSVCLILVHLNPTVEFNFKNYSSKLELEMAVSELIYSKGATGNISHLPYKHKTNLSAGLRLPKKNGNSPVAFIFTVSCYNFGHKKNHGNSKFKFSLSGQPPTF